MAKVVKTIVTDMPAFQQAGEYGASKVATPDGSRSESDCRNRYFGKQGKTKDPKDGRMPMSMPYRDQRW